MKPDNELDRWREQWQARSTVADGLRHKVERQTRMLRLAWIGELLVTAVFGGGSLGWAVVSPRPDVIVFAVGIWVFLTIAWSFAITNRRGIWEPQAMTTAAFLEISILRCRRRLQALTFSVAFYAAILAFDLAWIYHVRTERAAEGPWEFLTSFSILVVWAATAGLGLVAGWHRRRVRAELRNLEHIIEGVNIPNP